eukprot:TRINITY_DN4863_c0_g1_i1.p1 TRINITY_DN4863_c0_g1~~TRINITY_DN4863_c0_g1_i1.p1  ORF type:complete len:449 (-),score=151.81 TRINITY_DN4863_c0_g1_i1:213-1559(-)
MSGKESKLYACSKCFTRHPFEELSQGQQLCKKCRGDFPVVKCTYCRAEFQQESKSKTSSICKRCEQNVAQFGKPTSCQFCQLPAAFVGGKCQRCASYYKRYGAPKTCDQCKQKSAFDRGDNSPKLMCWACTCSYKRALAKTKHQDPARHSRVFKKDPKPKTDEEIRLDKEKRKEKHMNSKMPKRPDVTKLEHGQDSGGNSGHHSHHHHSSSHPPPPKVLKRERDDTDHVGEINQLKEKIAALEKHIRVKDNQLIVKDQEITQMKAKLFNEEKLIREKMKTMAKSHEDKVTELQNKTRSLQTEISRMRKDNKPSQKNKKMDNLFKNDKKFSKTSRTASPLSRSRSRSPVRSRSRTPARDSRSGSKVRSRSASRSRSPVNGGRAESPAIVNNISTTTISTNDSDGVRTGLNGKHEKSPVRKSPSPERNRSKSPGAKSRSRSSSPVEAVTT